MAKSAAASRTIDIFSGKTKEEECAEAQRIANDADLAEQKAKVREPITLESINKRTDIYCTARFDTTLDGFRLKRANNQGGEPWWYLEKLGYGGSAYCGVIIPESNIHELALMFSDASRSIKESNA